MEMEELPSEIPASILSGLPKVSRPELREVCKRWRNLLPKPRTCLLFGVPHETEEGLTEFYYSETNHNDKVSTDDHVDDDQLKNHNDKVSTDDHVVDDQLKNHNDKVSTDDHVVDDQLKKLNDYSLRLKAESFTKLVMVGSCNGLVCYAGYSVSRLGHFLTLQQVYICNPVTGDKIGLEIEEWDGDFWAEPGIGFDYNDSTNECKVVRILCDHRCRGGWVQVYTLKKDSHEWKSKTCKSNVDIAYYLSFSPSAGVFSGGALHWIDQDSTKRTPVAFDVEDETFELLPSVPSVAGYANIGLMVLGGNLCVLDLLPGEHVTVWELKNKDYVCPWVRKFSMAWEEDWSWFEFAVTKSDKLFLWYNVILSCYDHETKTLRKLDESLKKLMDSFTFWVYTTTRAIPFVIPLMEERAGNKRRKTFFL